MTSEARRPRFKYSAYWGTWNLVLTTRHLVGVPAIQRERHSGSTVEISLTPVNGWARAIAAGLNVDDMPSVRVHNTAVDAKDRFADSLPLEVELEMTEHLGFDLVAWLLDDSLELLGKIDWDAQRRLSNGGTPLRACLLTRFAHTMPQNAASEGAGRLAEALAA